MKVAFSRRFTKNYTKRIKPNKALVQKFSIRLKLFMSDPFDPALRLHRLQGDKNTLYSFSITGDVRVILSLNSDIAIFQDIGSHNQVY